MHRIVQILLLSLFSATQLSAQITASPNHGTMSLSMGHVYATSTGADALLGNQAGAIHGESLELLLTSERRFNLSELTSYAFAAVKKTSFGTVGLVLSGFGTDVYKEQKMGLAYSRKLTDKLSIGGQFDYLSLRIDGYGSQSLLTFELGLYTALTSDFHIGAHVYSPGSVQIGEFNEVPSIYRFGMKYIAGSKVNLFADIEKILDEDHSFHFGTSYTVNDYLDVRVGFTTEPGQFTFGALVDISKDLKVEIGNSYHEVLGNSPGVSLKYSKS